MKLYRCDKCALVYAFPSDIGRVPPCTRTWRESSRSGIIGEYDAYCGGALVPVTLEPDPTPVERDHGDRRERADREARHAYDDARDREWIEQAKRARAERDERIRLERADALSGSRRHYWRRARDFAPDWRSVDCGEIPWSLQAKARAEVEARWKAGWASLVEAERTGHESGGADS